MGTSRSLSPRFRTGNFSEGNREGKFKIREFVSVHFSHTCFAACGRDLFSSSICRGGERDGERDRAPRTAWRGLLAHHEAWCRSDLNQREYCEAHGIPLKSFGNWRAKFTAEPQPPARKLLYRRGGLSHTLSHPLSHMIYPSSGPVVPPAREGHRRRFSEADRHQIVAEAAQPDASLAKIARRYGIARRVLSCWKQELTPAFVTVEIPDASAPSVEERARTERAADDILGAAGQVSAAPGLLGCAAFECSA